MEQTICTWQSDIDRNSVHSHHRQKRDSFLCTPSIYRTHFLCHFCATFEHRKNKRKSQIHSHDLSRSLALPLALSLTLSIAKVIRIKTRRHRYLLCVLNPGMPTCTRNGGFSFFLLNVRPHMDSEDIKGGHMSILICNDALTFIFHFRKNFVHRDIFSPFPFHFFFSLLRPPHSPGSLHFTHIPSKCKVYGTSV